MEVTLLEAQGLPEGCILSIRSGTTRRQAPAEVGKFKLEFPRRPQSKAEPCRAEIFRKIGSQKLDITPGNNIIDVPINPSYYTDSFCEEHTLIGMRVALKVTDLNNPSHDNAEDMFVPGGSPEAAESMARRHRNAVEARTYLDEHRLVGWTQGLFRRLVKEKPEDPWEYIVEQSQFARDRHSQKANKANKSKGPAALTASAFFTAAAAAATDSDTEEQVPARAAPASSASLHRTAAGASSSGYPTAAMAIASTSKAASIPLAAASGVKPGTHAPMKKAASKASASQASRGTEDNSEVRAAREVMAEVSKFPVEVAAAPASSCPAASPISVSEADAAGTPDKRMMMPRLGSPSGFAIAVQHLVSAPTVDGSTTLADSKQSHVLSSQPSTAQDTPQFEEPHLFIEAASSANSDAQKKASVTSPGKTCDPVAEERLQTPVSSDASEAAIQAMTPPRASDGDGQDAASVVHAPNADEGALESATSEAPAENKADVSTQILNLEVVPPPVPASFASAAPVVTTAAAVAAASIPASRATTPNTVLNVKVPGQESATAAEALLQQPSEALLKQPSEALLQQPSEALLKQPSAAASLKQPSVESRLKQPSDAASLKQRSASAAELRSRQPSEPLLKQPSEALLKQPSEALLKQPSAAASLKQPSAESRLKQPSDAASLKQRSAEARLKQASDAASLKQRASPTERTASEVVVESAETAAPEVPEFRVEMEETEAKVLLKESVPYPKVEVAASAVESLGFESPKMFEAEVRRNRLRQASTLPEGGSSENSSDKSEPADKEQSAASGAAPSVTGSAAAPPVSAQLAVEPSPEVAVEPAFASVEDAVCTATVDDETELLSPKEETPLKTTTVSFSHQEEEEQPTPLKQGGRHLEPGRPFDEEIPVEQELPTVEIELPEGPAEEAPTAEIELPEGPAKEARTPEQRVPAAAREIGDAGRRSRSRTPGSAPRTPGSPGRFRSALFQNLAAQQEALEARAQQEALNARLTAVQEAASSQEAETCKEEVAAAAVAAPAAIVTVAVAAPEEAQQQQHEAPPASPPTTLKSMAESDMSPTKAAERVMPTLSPQQIHGAASTVDNTVTTPTVKSLNGTLSSTIKAASAVQGDDSPKNSDVTRLVAPAEEVASVASAQHEAASAISGQTNSSDRAAKAVAQAALTLGKVVKPTAKPHSEASEPKPASAVDVDRTPRPAGCEDLEEKMTATITAVSDDADKPASDVHADSEAASAKEGKSALEASTMPAVKAALAAPTVKIVPPNHPICALAQNSQPEIMLQQNSVGVASLKSKQGSAPPNQSDADISAKEAATAVEAALAPQPPAASEIFARDDGASAVEDLLYTTASEVGHPPATPCAVVPEHPDETLAAREAELAVAVVQPAEGESTGPVTADSSSSHGAAPAKSAEATPHEATPHEATPHEATLLTPLAANAPSPAASPVLAEDAPCGTPEENGEEEEATDSKSTSPADLVAEIRSIKQNLPDKDTHPEERRTQLMKLKSLLDRSTGAAEPQEDPSAAVTKKMSVPLCSADQASDVTLKRAPSPARPPQKPIKSSQEMVATVGSSSSSSHTKPQVAFAAASTPTHKSPKSSRSKAAQRAASQAPEKAKSRSRGSAASRSSKSVGDRTSLQEAEDRLHISPGNHQAKQLLDQARRDLSILCASAREASEDVQNLKRQAESDLNELWETAREAQRDVDGLRRLAGDVREILGSIRPRQRQRRGIDNAA